MAGIPDMGLEQILALPAGAIGIYVAVKVLWPLLSGVAQRAQTENGLYEKLSKERDTLYTRWIEADKRADELFEELQKVRSELSTLAMQLSMANDRINALTMRANRSTENHEDGSDKNSA